MAQGSQGPRTYSFSPQRVRPTSKRKPDEIHWAVYRRNLDGSEPRYYLSNAPEDTPLETLLTCPARGGALRLSSRRRRATLDEYETRTWAGWHHHVALCLLGGAFSEPAAGLGGKRCRDSRGRRCTAWCVRCCPESGSRPGELLSWLEGTPAQRAGQPLSREAPRRPLLTPEHPLLEPSL